MSRVLPLIKNTNTNHLVETSDKKDFPRSWEIIGEITFKKTPESVFHAFTVIYT